MVTASGERPKIYRAATKTSEHMHIQPECKRVLTDESDTEKHRIRSKTGCDHARKRQVARASRANRGIHSVRLTHLFMDCLLARDHHRMELH